MEQCLLENDKIIEATNDILPKSHAPNLVEPFQNKQEKKVACYNFKYLRILENTLIVSAIFYVVNFNA